MSTLLSAIRSLIFVLTLVVTVIPWALGVLVLSIFRRGDPVYWACAGWLKVAIWSARLICGIRWRIQGMENLPPASDRRAGVVLLSKHQSTWETFAYPALLSHPLAYVFKRELLYVPFFGWAMARMDMIHIDRGRRTEAWNKVLKQGKRLGGQGKYKTGGTRLAIEAGLPVVPIAATAARCWPRKSFLLKPGIVDISIGRQIRPEGREPAELMREVKDWIESEMRRLDPEAYAPPPAAGVAGTAAPTQR
jgi:1-acyl-sn-glycerol-3-phosphate acyltransferase